MDEKILKKLTEKSIKKLERYSKKIETARTEKDVFELERNAGKLRGYLECLWHFEKITYTDLKTLYTYFFEENRMEEK